MAGLEEIVLIKVGHLLGELSARIFELGSEGVLMERRLGCAVELLYFFMLEADLQRGHFLDDYYFY